MIGLKSDTQMNVIGHAADFKKSAFLPADDAADVFVEFISEGQLNQGLSMFGAEDDVVKKVGEGGSHNVTLLFPCRPFRASFIPFSLPGAHAARLHHAAPSGLGTNG